MNNKIIIIFTVLITLFCVSPKSFGYGQYPTPPAAPSDLTATAISASQINLSWTDNSNNEGGFEIWRGTSSTQLSTYAYVYANTATFSDPNLLPASTYYYKIRAYNGGGYSNFTNISNATTPFKIIYVNHNANGTHNGGSWTNAYTSLQDGLDDAEQMGNPNQEIWVAKGTYKPSKQTDPCDSRSATFKIIENVDIYGGFDGNEISIDTRNFVIHETILSGDIGTIDANSDNCYHVVTGPNDVNTVMDGFTITKGNANVSDGERQRGGGIYLRYKYAPTIKNCVIKNNYASQDGGGISICSSPSYSPKIISCTITENVSGLLGGGIYVSHGSPEIRYCNITNNSTDLDGGGIHWCGNGIQKGIIDNCIFANNTVPAFGGAIRFIIQTVNRHCKVAISNCVFNGNTTTVGGSGGAIYNGAQFNSADDLTFTNSVFVANKSANGGAISNSGTSPIITNCTFTNNEANSVIDGVPGLGGAIYNRYFSAYDGSASSPFIRNCIFWDNFAKTLGNEIFNEPNCDPNISYSDIIGCGGSGGGWDPNAGTDGGGNIDLDPNFADIFNLIGYDGQWMTNDDGLRIYNTRCIDAAIGNLAPEKDIIGNNRYNDPNWTNIGTGDPNYADMGAYEDQL